MRKFILASLLICSTFVPLSGNATACSSQWSWSVGACPDYADNEADMLNIVPQTANDGSFTYVRISQETVTAAGLTECVVGGDVDSACLDAIMIQNLKRMQTQITALGDGAPTYNYTSRALNSCFQISSTKAADFHYKVDVSSGTLLAGTATGTVTATSYTNSGCSTGAQAVSDGQASQGAALGILSVSQIASVALDGTLPAGRWLKIITAQTVGTPSFAIRAVQSEVIHP